MNELVKYERLPINTTVDLIEIGNKIAQSGMYGTTNPGDGLIIAATCQQEGFSLLRFFELYHIVGGKPTMKADAMLSRFEEVGGEYQILQRTSEVAECCMKYKNRTLTASFSWKDAQEEDYTKAKDGKSLKDNWKTPRRRMQMLWARLISDMIRTICPLANKGTYTPEEVMDTIDITPISLEPPKPKATKPEITGKMPNGRMPLNVHPPKVVDEADNTDYTVCPFGSDEVKNKKWETMSDDMLKYALDAEHPDKLPGHNDAIKAVLITRAEATGEIKV